MWISIGGLIYFGAFEFVTELFFTANQEKLVGFAERRDEFVD